VNLADLTVSASDAYPRNHLRRYKFLFALIAGLVGGAGVAYVPSEEASKLISLMPNPKWTPADVATIQLEALEYAAKDAKGFECCYRFASPSNTRVIGSLDEFTQLVQTNYESLIGSNSRLIGREIISDSRATVLVSCVGSDSSITCYRFMMSKLNSGPNADCWLTDSVIMITDGSAKPPDPSNEPPAENVSSLNKDAFNG
jgi:hypothetical protein